MLEYNVIKKLRDITGKQNVHTELEFKICYSYDATNKKFIPDAVVFPTNTQQVSEILKLANSENVCVVPRGAGTGFSGGALAISGGIVMVLTKMNRILKINAKNFTAEVEPGVITYDFHQAVEKLGLFYPPDPGSKKTSTLGGNVAECAGGPRTLRYGVTKDYVIGLDVVLPTGEIINTGTNTIKGVVGYDLTKLIIGSEGTLAVVTKIKLRLLPKPAGRKTMLAFFQSVHNAAEAVPQILHQKVLPSALEFLDKATIHCIKDEISKTKIIIPEHTRAILIIEVDGKNLNDKVKMIKDVLNKGKVIKVIVANDDEEQEQIWNVRRVISPVISKIAPKKINEDIVVPRDKISETISMIEDITAKYSLNIVTFGHAGDGNLHVNIMIDDKDEDEAERADKALYELFEKVVAFGGTLSGEHGVGITKSAFLRLELSKTEIELMKKIKQIFDPNNILNPNKIFYDGDFI
jgi:glycolate oxidase